VAVMGSMAYGMVESKAGEGERRRKGRASLLVFWSSQLKASCFAKTEAVYSLRIL